MQALDLYVEDEIGRDFHPFRLFDICRELLFVLLFDRAECGKHILKERIEFAQLRKVGMPFRSDPLVDLLRHFGIVQKQPAAGRDAVGDIHELVGILFVPIAEGLPLQNIGVNLRNSVHPCGDVNRKICHVNDSVFHDIIAVGISPFPFQPLLADENLRIDVGKQIFERKRVPFFQRFRHDRVVGEVERAGADIKRFFKGQPFQAKKTEHFGNCKHGMRVVELEHIVFGQFGKRLSRLFVLAEDILQRRAHHEILLTQAQNLSHHRIVVGIQDVGDLGRVEVFFRNPFPLHLVETCKIERAQGLALPQAQRVHHIVVIAEDRHVVRNRQYRLIGKDDFDRFALYAHAPGIPPSEPVVALLVLESVEKTLTEQPVTVADSVSVHGKIFARRAFQIACRKPTEAAVAERSVFHFLEFTDIHPYRRHDLFRFFQNAQIEQVGKNRSSHQELCGEICAAFFFRIDRLFPVVIRPHHDCLGQGVIHFFFVGGSEVARIIGAQNLADIRKELLSFQFHFSSSRRGKASRGSLSARLTQSRIAVGEFLQSFLILAQYAREVNLFRHDSPFPRGILPQNALNRRRTLPAASGVILSSRVSTYTVPSPR